MLLETRLLNLLQRGKVRGIHAVNDDLLLLIVTDRGMDTSDRQVDETLQRAGLLPAQATTKR